MRKLSILKTLIDLAFFFSAITVLSIIIFIPMMILGYADDFPIRMNGVEIAAYDLPTKLILVCAGIGGLFFFYSLYLFRSTISFFTKRDIFNDTVIHNFNRIGKFLVASSLMISVPFLFYSVFYGSKLNVSLDVSFGSPLLAISLGLFFMVLSEVFKIAKNLKEENDLTL